MRAEIEVRRKYLPDAKPYDRVSIDGEAWIVIETRGGQASLVRADRWELEHRVVRDLDGTPYLAVDRPDLA